MASWLDPSSQHVQSGLKLVTSSSLPLAIAAAILVVTYSPANGQIRSARPRATPPARVQPTQPMKKAADLIKRQAPMTTNASVLRNLTPDTAYVVVSISRQRAYLMSGDQVAIDSPISSGKRGHSTPTGKFSILEKDKDHRSSIYGDYVDSAGRVVRGGISSQIDSAPSGTHFVGAPMKWFMRLTGEGVGMHVGILPGYPASHGCIRMPEPAAALFYSHVKVGTTAIVEP